jgi:hypothetical protein
MTSWLAPSEHRWTYDGVEWAVTLKWADADGIGECVGIELALADGNPLERLTSSTVRSLPLGRLVRESKAARYAATGGEVVEAFDAGSEKSRSRRPALDDAHYAEVARVYSRAVGRGSAPRQAVMERWHATAPTASRWVAKARSLGLLPETSPGKARPNPALVTSPEAK